MHQLIIAPTTLQDTAPIEYIEATIAAGYDGIGLRVHRSPGLPFFPVVGDIPLIRGHAQPARGFRPRGARPLQLLSRTRHESGNFAPAMELGASFGAKYATVMGADTDWSRQRDNFVQDLRSRGAVSASPARSNSP